MTDDAASRERVTALVEVALAWAQEWALAGVPTEDLLERAGAVEPGDLAWLARVGEGSDENVS